MKRHYNYYLVVTTSTETYFPTSFDDFDKPSRTVEAKFCLETTKKRLTHRVIRKTMRWLEREFNSCFKKDGNEMHVRLNDNEYKVYTLSKKPNIEVLIVHI